MESYTRPHIKLDRDLVELRDNVLRLSHMTNAAIEKAVHALKEHDLPLARQIMTEDSEINAFRYRVEQECYHLLAMQQPTAGDMRRVVTAMHIAVELERMADHAAGIAKLTIELAKESTLKISPTLPKMGQIAREMLRASLEAYLNKDAALAQQILARDDEMDALDKKMYTELLECMVKDPSKINSGTYLLWVSHNLERIADHVTNICERVIFMVTGEIPVEPEG